MSDLKSIADLPVVDDLNVPVDPTEYADQANAAPAAPGAYRFIVTKVEPKTLKDSTELVLTDGKFPVLSLVQVKIVEPVENERLVGLWQDIRTKPQIRKNNRGSDVSVNDFYDFLRSFDASIVIENFEHAKQLLQQYVDQGTTFVAGLAWNASDFNYVDAEFNKIGADTNEKRRAVNKDVANAIYNKSRKNTKDFIVNGKRVAQILGPSGNMLDARPKLNRYYPSHVALDGVMVPNPDLLKAGFLGAYKAK